GRLGNCHGGADGSHAANLFGRRLAGVFRSPTLFRPRPDGTPAAGAGGRPYSGGALSPAGAAGQSDRPHAGWRLGHKFLTRLALPGLAQARFGPQALISSRRARIWSRSWVRPL